MLSRNFLLLLLAGCLFYTARAQQTYAITGVNLFDSQTGSLKPRQTVVISNGYIKEIFTDGAKALPDTMAQIPMKGKYLLPGLIDTHVHLATDPSGTDNRNSTLQVLDRMLHSGVTSVRDMAGDARVLAGLSRDAAVGDITSPDIYYAALMAGPSFFADPRTVVSSKGGIAGAMPYMQAVTDTTDLVLAVAEAKGTGATGIKLYANLNGALAKRITTEAHKQHMLVWAHAWLNPAKPQDVVAAGVNSISHAPLLLRISMDSLPASWRKSKPTTQFWQNAATSAAALFTQMKQQHTILDATMLTYQQWALQDSTMQNHYEATKLFTAAAHKDGVIVCAGTDDDQHHFVQNEIELLVHDAGFSAADAIIAATKYGAEAIGIENTTGTIEPGKKADLLITDKNPLEKIENIRSVVMVIKHGKRLE
ncbi:MAG: amidohydrolase family protein [Chitinophagaceae bacterium]